MITTPMKSAPSQMMGRTTKYTAAIESKTLPDVAELDAVGPARLANLGRLSDVSDLVGTVTKELGELARETMASPELERYFSVPITRPRALSGARMMDLISTARSSTLSPPFPQLPRPCVTFLSIASRKRTCHSSPL